MKIIETRVTSTTIHMWLANDPELQNATEWLEVELPINSLARTEGRHALVDLRLEVLRTIRNAVDHELEQLGTQGRRRLPVKSG